MLLQPNIQAGNILGILLKKLLLFVAERAQTVLHSCKRIVSRELQGAITKIFICSIVKNQFVLKQHLAIKMIPFICFCLFVAYN